MHQGSCLCGAVHYEIHGEIGPAAYCHCSRCRKAGGSAFASNGAVRAADFKVTRGEASMKDYDTGTGVHRVFCAHCGSPLFSRRDTMPDVLRLRLGTLDTPLAAPPGEHIFVGSKANWYEIHDELPQHAERAPV